MAEELSIIVRLKDMASKGFRRLAQNVGRFGKGFAGAVGGVLTSLKTLTAGFLGFGAVVALFTKSLQTAFEFEKFETQFEVLFGNLEQAQQHFADLKEFSNTTPFQLTDIAAASKVMLAMTGGVLGLKDSLLLVGDAAAAVGQPIQEVGMWTARAYGAIRNGQPFGEAAARLQEMGILSGETRKKMEELQKEGAKNSEVWAMFQEELEKNEGGMEKLSQTGDGLISTLKDKWTNALAAFGDKFKDLAKDKITALIEKIDKLMQDGTIDKWANHALEAMEALGRGVSWVIDKIDFAARVIKKMNDGAGLGEAIDQVTADKIVEDDNKKKEELRKARGQFTDEEKEQMKKEQEARDAADRKAAEEKKKAQKRLLDDLAKGQAAADEKERKKHEEKERKKREKTEQELKKLAKKLEQHNRQVRQKELKESIARTQIQLKEAEFDAKRARDRRLETVKERRAREKEEIRRARNREFTPQELEQIKGRNDLSKGEKLALEMEQKNIEKVAKLVERQKEGQRLSPFERRLIEEREAEVARQHRVRDLEMKRNKEILANKLRDDQQAQDIKLIRQKHDQLLQMR